MSLNRRGLHLCCAVVLLLAGPASALATTVTVLADADTYVWSVAPDNNFGHSQAIEVGRRAAKSGPVLRTRGLLHFDLSAVPAGAILNAVNLRLFVDATSHDPLNLPLTVRRLQAGFTEGDGSAGVTWNTSRMRSPRPAPRGR